LTRRIAIVGANGRVGTELALRLRDVPDIDVVGVCRTPAGSAFLRFSGVECLHGDCADDQQASRLLAQCDVVVQLAYRPPRSRADYRSNRAIAENCVAFAPSESHILAASTIMVYAPELPVRVPDAYGMEKLLLERLVRRVARSTSHGLTVLRIGHALGPSQPQSREVLDAVRAGVVELPDGGRRPSNTVFVACLADTVVRAAERALPMGTFDLVTQPQWTWADVFGYYAKEVGREFRPAEGPMLRPSLARVVEPRLRGALGVVPDAWASRAYGCHLRRMAIRQDPEPVGGPSVPRASGWRGVGRLPLPGLLAPMEALERYALRTMPNSGDAAPHWRVSRWESPSRAHPDRQGC
jgi:nucleoside-diphosphate-sugar epimerase